MKLWISGCLATVFAFSLAAPSAQAEPVTFTKDIAPILQQNCQECHHAGEPVPMSLVDYKDIRPWAKSIKTAVEQGTMPPWHADPSIGDWANDRTMAPEEIKTISDWVDQGAQMGNPADLPEPLEFTDGWKLGEPDMIFEMPAEMVLAADLVDEYKYVRIPTGLAEDRWISAVEVRPGNVEVVHHVIVFVQSPGASGRGGLEGGLGGYAPGLQPYTMRDGHALYLPANATLVLQMHYNKEPGFEATDQTKIGVKFAKGLVEKRLRTTAVGDRTFVIPPGESNHEVNAQEAVAEDITLYSITPHMHLRGTDMKVWAQFPDGRTEDLLNVPGYDFNWQTSYKLAEPLKIPAGTQLYAKAHFDNSTGNPFNPDPTSEVRWGLPTYAEMMFAFYSYSIDDEEINKVDPSSPMVAGAGG